MPTSYQAGRTHTMAASRPCHNKVGGLARGPAWNDRERATYVVPANFGVAEHVDEKGECRCQVGHGQPNMVHARRQWSHCGQGWWVGRVRVVTANGRRRDVAVGRVVVKQTAGMAYHVSGWKREAMHMQTHRTAPRARAAADGARLPAT